MFLCFIKDISEEWPMDVAQRGRDGCGGGMSSSCYNNEKLRNAHLSHGHATREQLEYGSEIRCPLLVSLRNVGYLT